MPMSAHRDRTDTTCFFKTTRRDALIGGCVLLFSFLSARAADTDKLEKLTLRISAGNAPVTLAELVRQTGLQVLFDFDAVSGATTREVNGNLDVREALVLMFAGSELTFEFINDRTIAVRPRPHREKTVVAQPTGHM